MKQMIKETAPEVKREIPAESRKRESFRIPEWLAAKSDEACCELLSKAGRVERFPAMYLTHAEEVARFFCIEKVLWYSFRKQVINLRRRYSLADVLPVVNYYRFIEQMKKQAELTGVSCKEATDAAGNHYFSTDGNPQHMVKLGNPHYFAHGLQLISMRGIILLAFYMERNTRFATPVTRNIVRLCRETGFDQVPQPEPEPIPEPAPATETPAESPKLDYAETLRKLFDSVLTLVEKQAEERGAEKIVQKLKEAGKL